MTVFNIIGPVIGILVIFLSLYFPIYLVLFILRRIKAAKIGPGAGPSILSLVLYLLIIALAAAGTVPNFLKFAAKSKTSEAKQNLGAIYTCQVAYFGEEETYGGGPDALDLINFAPEGRNLYAYYCGEDMIGNKKRSPIKINRGRTGRIRSGPGRRTPALPAWRSAILTKTITWKCGP